MDMAEIGANIRSCRTEKDMTMEELGKAIGKSQSAVADYEKGRVDIPASLSSRLQRSWKSTRRSCSVCRQQMSSLSRTPR